MKTRNAFVGCLIIGTIAVAAVSDAAAQSWKRGTDILHFFVREGFVNEGVETNLTGAADARQNTQGKANNQRLDLSFSGLDTNAVYQLYAVIDEDDTNYTHVTELTPNSSGNVALRYRKIGNGKSAGKGHAALPAVLEPLCSIRQLAVFNSSTQLVATADFTLPDKLQYLIKRDLGTNDVNASLRIKATTTQAQFRLMAGGLGASNDYLLVLNGEAVENLVSDSKGRINFSTSLENPEEILDLRSVALWNSASNVVFSTKLP